MVDISIINVLNSIIMKDEEVLEISIIDIEDWEKESDKIKYGIYEY